MIDWREEKFARDNYGVHRSEFEDRPKKLKKDEHFPFPTDFKPEPEPPIEVHVPGPVEQHLHAGADVRTLRGGAAAQELWAEQSQRVRDGLEPNRLDASEGSNYPYTDAEVENTKPNPVFNPPAQAEQADVESKVVEDTDGEGFRIRITQEGPVFKGTCFFAAGPKSRDMSVVGKSIAHVRTTLRVFSSQNVTARDTEASIPNWFEKSDRVPGKEV